MGQHHELVQQHPRPKFKETTAYRRNTSKKIIQNDNDEICFSLESNKSRTTQSRVSTKYPGPEVGIHDEAPSIREGKEKEDNPAQIDARPASR